MILDGMSSLKLGRGVQKLSMNMEDMITMITIRVELSMITWMHRAIMTGTNILIKWRIITNKPNLSHVTRIASIGILRGHALESTINKQGWSLYDSP